MTFSEYRDKRMKDPEFKKAYEEFGPEYEIIKAIIEARSEKNITQKHLSEITGI
jgi:hypothetical protein